MNTHSTHPCNAEISLQHAVPQEARQSPHMGLYNRADNPNHPTGVRCQDPTFARILDTLQPDGLYHLATFDPLNLDQNKRTMLDLQQTGNQKYLYGRDAAELVGKAINRLIETKTIDLTTLDLIATNPPQLINTQAWKQIEALTGPLSTQDATALSNGLVIATSIKGQETNIAFREQDGIIPTNWPDYKAVNDTFTLLVNDNSNELLKNLTSEQRSGYMNAIAEAIPPTLEQLQSGNITGLFPPLRYHYGIYVSELNSVQIADNTLTALSPSGKLNETLIGPLITQLDSLKPDATYHIALHAHSEHGVLPIYRKKEGSLLTAVAETMWHKTEGHYVTGNDVKAVLSDLLTEYNNHLDQKATVPYLELNNNLFTITAKQVAALEKQLGPLDSYAVYQLANGKPITIDTISYAYRIKDGQPAINPVNKPGVTTTRVNLIDKPADTKDVQLYRQAADQFGVMLNPETIARLLSGQRSDMLMATDTKVGKLVLVNQPNGQPVLRLLEKKEKLTIPSKIAGYTLTTKDRENLIRYGEMGKLVPMVSGAGKAFNGYVGVDKDLNTLTILKAHLFKLPHAVKGVSLDETQREQLKQGRSVAIENMEGKKGHFHAFVRIAASSGKLSFQPIRNVERAKKTRQPQAQAPATAVNKSLPETGPKPTRQTVEQHVGANANQMPASRPPKKEPEKTLTATLHQSANNQTKSASQKSRPKQKIR